MRQAGAIALALLLSGCSALGLADGLEQSPCMTCEDLNTIEPTGDACLSWQCDNLTDPMAGNCVVGVLDADGDGSPSSMCVSDETADCDDARDDRGQLVAESCDLVDNDCDDVVDEGALTLTRADLTSAVSASALSTAQGDMEIVAIYNEDSRLVATHLPFSGTAMGSERLMGPAMLPNPRFTSVARTGTDWVVGYSPRSGCSRIVLGTWSGSGGELLMPADHDVDGLPKASGDCLSGDSSAVGHIALASAVDRQVLAAYLADSEPRTCGAAAVDVGLVVAQRTTTLESFGEGGMLASAVVGQSVDTSPALVALGGGFGYLLAYARSDSTVVVHRVVVDGASLETTVTPEVHLQPCSRADCGDVSLRAVPVGSSYEVALTFRDGDCDQASAALRVLTVDPASGTVEALGDLQLAEMATGLRRPVAARRSAPDEWVVAWTHATGPARAVSMQRWGAAGTQIGVIRELLRTMGTLNQPITAAGGTGLEGFRVFGYDSEPDMLVRSAAECVMEAD